MYKTPEEIAEKVFTSKVRSLILSNLKTGLKAFQEFIKSNEDFLSYSNIANFYPLARSYAIVRQFAIESKKATSPFTFSYKEFGRYKYKVSFLHMDGIIATFAKTYKPDSLPNRSKYKLELASANVFENSQISIFDLIKEPHEAENISNRANYCLITYGVLDDMLTHARIIIPSYDFRKIEYNIDILNSIEVVENVPVEEKVNIARLKKELEQIFMKKGDEK